MFQRNPYLQRTHSSTPHYYSFDMQTGRYYLEHSGNIKERVQKTGKLPTKFKPYGSGFFTAKKRYEQAQVDKSAMHFVPDLTYQRHKSLYTPITDKFMGYAQFPFKANMPEHLELQQPKASKIVNFQKQLEDSQNVKHPKHLHRRATSKKRTDLIITCQLTQKQPNQFFEMSMTAMTNSRPLPMHVKKTCYDDRCRLLGTIKRFSIQSIKKQPAKDMSLASTTMNETLNKSYFQKRLRQQTSFTSTS